LVADTFAIFSMPIVSHMPKSVVSRGPLDDLLVFHELARALTSTLDLASILRTILESMERFIDAELWALLMVDPERQELYYASADGGEDPRFADMRVKMGEGLAGWVAAHGETLIIPEAAADPRLAPSANGNAFIVRSAIGLPIRGRKGTHGVLEIFNPNLDGQSDYSIAFLHILVDYAAIAIENAQDVARVQQLTITDDVTGLYNARHLYTELERELETARNASKPLSLVFLDLDRFKLVNDQHGHLIGSELLGRVGKRIQDLCRPTDLCFRYGGDEFVILMPATTREEALRMTRAIHTNLASSVFSFEKGLKLSIEASAGISAYPGDGKTVHAILGAADKRMYKVKSTGRGRVEA
jgi:diguanylate cyclase (GGDEF)-like protein